MPEEIINLLSDVRTYLQDKCEPPVYVSDRRLVKAVAIMQVSIPFLHVASVLFHGHKCLASFTQVVRDKWNTR